MKGLAEQFKACKGGWRITRGDRSGEISMEQASVSIRHFSDQVFRADR